MYSIGQGLTLKQQVIVSSTAAAVKQGTHAHLRPGDALSLHDLLWVLCVGYNCKPLTMEPNNEACVLT